MTFRTIDLRQRNIGDRIKIMHISDLHFNQIDRDKKLAFESDLHRYIPNIIVITGDIINSPWFNWYNRNYDEAKIFIDYLNQTADLIIIASGNHEKLFWINKDKFLQKFDLTPFYCKYVQLPDNRNITFFVFDSASYIFQLRQRGKISANQLLFFRNCIEKLHTQYAQDYQRSYKIAVLHHHPLPTKKNDLDNVLYLKNSGEFIENLNEANINMILHGHQHDPVDYSFQWDLRYMDPQPHMTILSAGTLLKLEKQTLGVCEKTNYYLIDLYKDKIEGTEMRYNYSLKEFFKNRHFKQKNHIPSFYKLNVDLTWEIIHPNYDNRVTRILTFRAWYGETIPEIIERIGSTVKADFNDLNFSVDRSHGSANVNVVEQVPGFDIDLKDIKISLNPPMLHGDDMVTIKYIWPGDFREDLSRNYVEDSYFEPYFVDEFTLRIKSEGFDIGSCRIWAGNEIVDQPKEANTWEFKIKGLRERIPIYYALSF